MLGRIDMKEFMEWTENVKAKSYVEEFVGGTLVFTPKHTRKIGKLNAAYAFGCDGQNGGGGN